MFSLSPAGFFSSLLTDFTDMSFINSVFAKLKRHPKRIVFPDGDDPRVIRAARLFYERDLGVPILLGKRDEIERVAAAENVDLDHVAMINPETSSDLPVFCERLERLDRYKNLGVTDSRAMMTNHNYFAAMMVQYGLADAVVGGVSSYGGIFMRPLLHLIKPLPHAEVVSSCTIVELEKKSYGDEGVIFLADTGVVPDPTMQQLASIAVQTGLVARQVFGRRPRVALLSFSTKGSARTASTEKVAGATELARQLAAKLGAEIAVDGEMQADAALDPVLAEKKMGPSLVAGKANVLIFPDLNSGNIAVKLIHHLAAARTFGQLILGLTRPAADLSRGATTEEIVCMAALVGLQAIEYRKLYPERTE
jgi:phosphate acetyltransferase